MKLEINLFLKNENNKKESTGETVSPLRNIKMVKFQTRNLGDDILGSEKMKITPLGAGSEVGRSCIIVEFKGKTIMVNIVSFLRMSNYYVDGLWNSSGICGNVGFTVF
jgi:predicted metal-dependent RNase